MLDNVIVGDIMEEETALPSEERPVDSGCGAALEIPFFSAIMKIQEALGLYVASR